MKTVWDKIAATQDPNEVAELREQAAYDSELTHVPVKEHDDLIDEYNKLADEYDSLFDDWSRAHHEAISSKYTLDFVLLLILGIVGAVCWVISHAQ